MHHKVLDASFSYVFSQALLHCIVDATSSKGRLQTNKYDFETP